MEAVIVKQPGGPEELGLAEVSDPVAGENELLVDVHAAALNRADLLQRRGLYPPPEGASPILGLECAGIVSATGPGVSRAKRGDRVMALLAGGGYAEKVVIPEAMALPIPDNLDFISAAAIPESFLTASEALFSLAKLSEGETVLIHAAGSGVGTAAIQLARQCGGTVIGTAGTDDKLALARDLGCELTFNYRHQDFGAELKKAGIQVDVIADFVGKSYLPGNLSCLKSRGRLLILGLLSGARAEIDLGLVLRKRLSILGLAMRSRPASEKYALSRRFRRDWLTHFEDGRLRPVIDSVFPLTEVEKAHRLMEANRNLGKIVLRVR